MAPKRWPGQAKLEQRWSIRVHRELLRGTMVRGDQFCGQVSVPSKAALLFSRAARLKIDCPITNIPVSVYAADSLRSRNCSSSVLPASAVVDDKPSIIVF